MKKRHCWVKAGSLFMEEKTNYQISTSVHEGVLEIVMLGEVTQNTIERLHTEMISIIREKDAKAVLADVSALKGFHDPFAAAYFRARSIPKDILCLPAAVVDIASKITSYQSFYETTAANVGQKLKWFNDIEDARTWLRSLL